MRTSPTLPAKSVAPLTLALKPSRRLSCTVGLGYGLAALATLANPLPWGMRVPALAAVLAGAALAWRPLCRVPPVSQLRVDENGEWKLWTAAGDELRATLLPSTVATPWLLVLHFRDESGRFRALPLLPDSLEPGGFRRLLVRLRTLSGSVAAGKA